MAQWVTSETGILRKNRPTENLDELLVFGYACKLFRDDDKAIYVDQGKHLIPWMGDNSLKIDRYDCRGALSSLKQYEGSREGFDAMRWLGLSESDRRLEELCDKERYYSLEINEEEEELYKEEELKRQKSNVFQYNYDVPKDPDAPEEVPTVPEKEEEDEPYVPLSILDVPVDIDIPKTVKEYARIEKTAIFVCKQGPQMEILIKAKQGSNPQFSFLTQGDTLYKFYRHLLMAFKNGRYQAQYDSIKSDEKPDAAQDQDQTGDYLHPSLISAVGKSDQITTPTATPATVIPTVPYRPSANCAYSQLVNRIQGNSQSEQAAAAAAASPAESYGGTQSYAQMTPEQQQYYMYYYVQQYYEYYKHMVMAQGENAQMVQLPDHFQQLDPNMQNYIQQLAFAQYMQQQPQHTSSTSYAQIVSNLNKDGGNPYTANVPQLPPEAKEPHHNIDAVADRTSKQTQIDDKNPVNTVKKSGPLDKPLLSLAAAYGSGSDTESEDDADEQDEESPKVNPASETNEVYHSPIGEMQVVIDKMAAYVSKNGEQFEEIVKAKNDARFEFLNENHEFNKYYRKKIKELKGETEEKPKEVKLKKVKSTHKSPTKPKKVIAPVCFSIKKAKEDPPKEIKSALPIEESDEEIEETSENRENTASTVTSSSVTSSTVASLTVTPTTVIQTNTVSNSQKTVTTSTVSQVNSASSSQKTLTTESSTTVASANGMVDLENKDGADKSENGPAKTNGVLDPDDPILEMMTLTGTELVKDAKRAEDKIKDKLATAAREKLASVARDKALQLERKRKAAAFLRLKSGETNTSAPDIVLSPVTKSPSKTHKSTTTTTAQKSPSTVQKSPSTALKSPSSVQKSPGSSHKSPISTKSPRSDTSNSRRSLSVEIIEDVTVIVDDKKSSKEKRKAHGAHKEKSSRERDKKRAKLSDSDEETHRNEESSRDNHKRKKEKKSHKKKSHKRKHSKSRHDLKSSRKKSKKHKKKSESVSDSDGSETP